VDDNCCHTFASWTFLLSLVEDAHCCPLTYALQASRYRYEFF
jgi:hypothetical protein